MAKFPEPPSPTELARVRPDYRWLPAGTRFFRIYSRGGSHPSHWNGFRPFGPTSSRFDHQTLPQGVQNRRILYAALGLGTCVAEVFQALRVIDRSTSDPWVVELRLQEWLRLLDLSREWPTRAGASMALNSGRRDRAQRWARAAYEAYPFIQCGRRLETARFWRPETRPQSGDRIIIARAARLVACKWVGRE